MRRIGRYIHNGLTVLSLLLCITTFLLFGRSGARQLVELKPEPERRIIYTHLGTLYYRQDMGWPDLNDPTWGDEYDRRFLGFGTRGIWANSNNPNLSILSSEYIREWFVPFWSIAVVLLVLPVRFVVMWARRLRIGVGHCPVCNYDLRASPDRCPECGTEVTKNQPPTATDSHR